MSGWMDGAHLMLSAEPLPTCRPYAVPMVGNSLRAFWNEPRPASPPVRVWRDWVLFAVVLAGSALEVVLREDRAWLGVAVAVSVVIACTLLWRRTHPLAAVAVAFGTMIVFDLVRIVAIDATGLYSSAAALVLSYALLRWGAGREATIGLGIVVVWLAVTHVADPTSPDEVVAGYGFFLFAAALGASIRFHATTRLRDIEQAKLRLRNDLARELHDTVGHHVSAIAIQAQAGRAMAASQPDRALAVLGPIEESASRALEEMRAMVGVLRDDGVAELAPQPGIAAVEHLARDVGAWPRVEVHLSGDLDSLPPSVGTALYRIAQEAVTNAMRHARNATRVSVEVYGEADRVHLTVRDDGNAPPTGAPTAGFGLLGMTERSSLLGGDVQAGPAPGGGWTVDATLPRGRPTKAPHQAVERPS
jgi:signal transduction histidine kinase